MADRNPRPQSLGPWTPFRDFGPFATWPIRGLPLRALSDALRADALRQAAGARFAPAIDLVEHEDGYVLTAELPGVRRQDVSVEMHGRSLSIRGEKSCEYEIAGQRRHTIERCFGAFGRSVTLPVDADADALEASFADGLLTVRIPKRRGAGRQAVPIRG